MTKEKQGKGILQKILTGLLTLAMVFTMLNLPMFAQTVKAEDQVKIELTYLYVNTAGENSLYVDTQYVPAGTTWGDFFDSYQKCYSNGTIADANADNEWEMSIQGLGYSDESVLDTVEITNYNQYSDCAAVTFYGYPSTYKKAYFAFEYYEGDVLADSGNGWEFFMPASYSFASDEAIAFVGRNIGIYSYIAELCNTPGAAVTVEGLRDSAGVEGMMDGYLVNITVSNDADDSGDSGNTNDSDNSGDSGNTNDADNTGDSSNQNDADNTGNSGNTNDSGQSMNRIFAEGNGDISVVGAEAYIPSGAKFASAELTSGDVYNRAAQIVSQKISGATGFRIFDMNLVDASNVAIHQLNGYINVTLPIPDGLSADNGKRLVTYRIEEDGSLTKCDTATSNGYLTFATNHFSTYVIVEEASATAQTAPKTGEDNTVFIWSLIALAAGVCSVFMMKKRMICTK